VADEAVVRIVVQDEGQLDPQAGQAAERAKPEPFASSPAFNQPPAKSDQRPADISSQPVPSPIESSVSPSVAASSNSMEAILADAREAFIALGKTATEAEKMVDDLRQSGQAFANAQQAVMAAFSKTPAASSAQQPASPPVPPSVPPPPPVPPSVPPPPPPSPIAPGLPPVSPATPTPPSGGISPQHLNAAQMAMPQLGAASSALAAAGPIGLAIMVAMEAEKSLRGHARSIGNAGAAIANPDANPSRAVTEAGNAVAESFHGLIGVSGELTASFGRIMQAVDATANRYAEFSPEISQAQAMVEVRHTMGEMRRAQEAGPELARYVQMQGELQQKFEDTKIKLLVQILPIVTAIMGYLEKAMSAGSDITQAITTLAGPLNSLCQLVDQWRGIQQDANRPPVDDPTNMIINLNPGAGFGQSGAGLSLPPPT